MQACGERKQQTSSAMTGGERGGICGLMCARKWGRGAQACVHKFQKPEKRLAAVVPRCADAVSYTHLDVYKRQLQNHAKFAIFHCTKSTE